jgi:hypothetical protein
MNHIMLDLETMGTGPNAAIVAIGAVEFEINKTPGQLGGGQLGDTFYMPISLDSAMASGGQVDAGTVLWWLKQTDAARAMFTHPAIEHGQALANFSSWMHQCGEFKNLRVWGNGASFDNVILASAYRRAALPLPWNGFNDRCYRTVKSMHPTAPALERVGTHHNAMDDAISQAKHLIAMLSPATV